MDIIYADQHNIDYLNHDGFGGKKIVIFDEKKNNKYICKFEQSDQSVKEVAAQKIVSDLFLPSINTRWIKYNDKILGLFNLLMVLKVCLSKNIKRLVHPKKN